MEQNELIGVQCQAVEASCEVVCCLRDFFRNDRVKSYLIDPFSFFLPLCTWGIPLVKDSSRAAVQRIPWKRSNYGFKEKQRPMEKIRELTGRNKCNVLLEQGVRLKEMQGEGTVMLIKMYNLCWFLLFFKERLSYAT